MSESQAPMTAPAPDVSQDLALCVPTGRRRAVLAGLGGLGLLGMVRAVEARPDPSQVSADVDPSSLLVKLVRRVGFGFTRSEYALASELGYEGYLEYHLNPAAISDSEVEARVATLTTLTMSYNQLLDLANISQVMNEFTEAIILRAALSRRQLFERVVEFWNDHFNIDINNDGNVYLNPAHDRTVIRPNALGRFEALLTATAQSPAMLYYLNNDVSTGLSPNENYARELLELHTLGTGSGFTQDDVVDVARCFTGWTWWQRNGGEQNGSFRYAPELHDDGDKIVLGNVIAKGGGMQDGLTVLRILAEHPATSRFIAGKLCRKFVSESCPSGVIEHVARVFRLSYGDIRAAVRAAFQPNVQADAAPKLSRPFHQMIAAVRGLPTTIATTAGLRGHLNAAGHRPFFWSTPDGYPDTIDYWSGLVITRWNFGASLMQNHISGATVDYAAFFAGATTEEEMADRINEALFGGELSAEDRDELRDYLIPWHPAVVPTTTQQREAIGIALGSPTFQWH